MAIGKREGNNPKRRIAFDEPINTELRDVLYKKLTYIGSANHKLRPGNYGFVPASNPRPSKSPCDALRGVLMEEAAELMRAGIARGMMSEFAETGVPKYIWAMDEQGEVYEAKTNPSHETAYHGYRLGDDEIDMRSIVLALWGKRCPK
jgi:hypothetical protein